MHERLGLTAVRAIVGKMSDDEFLMDDAADDEEYDFDYDEDDDDAMDQDGKGDVENQYYIAKGLRDDAPEDALKAFRAIVDEQSEKGEWGFKALKQAMKMTFLRLHRPDEALAIYKELLSYTKSDVTRNYAEKSINNILDYVSGEGKHASLAPTVPLDTLEAFYEATRTACEDAKNERLLVRSNVKLAQLWLDKREYTRLSTILDTLRQSCGPVHDPSSTSSEDQTKGSLLLEIYSIQIQMYSDLRETRKLKEIYHAASEVRNAIPHPRIMGVIKECGGKMWMTEKSWDKASTDLFESFRQYDESGSPQRIQVLKYLVLTYMLMGSDINPFDSQETKPYRNDPQITAMTNLVSAYQRRDVQDAERILKANQATITNDPFIRTFIEELLRSLRMQFIIDLVKPYTRVNLANLANTLNVPIVEVEGLLIALILDDKIDGRLDQVQGTLELDQMLSSSSARCHALNAWAEQAKAMTGRVTSKGNKEPSGTWIPGLVA